MNILVIDTETTGFNANYDHIIELAIIKLNLENYNYITVFNSVCNPGLPPEILETAFVCRNGYISINEILKAPKSEDIVMEIHEILQKTPFWTSFNVDFDRQFLEKKPFFISQSNLPCIMKAATKPCGIPHPYYGIKYPTLTEAYNILVNPKSANLTWNWHRAETDCIMATEVLIALHKMKEYQI